MLGNNNRSSALLASANGLIGNGPFLDAQRAVENDASGRIPFNRPTIAGRELLYIAQTITFENISGDGHFTDACSSFLEQNFGIGRALMVTSCTAALEMSVQLCNVGPGDEVIVPSYTFVSCANAVARVGGVPVFVDIRPDTLNIDETLIEAAITPRTKAIMPVHYAGVGCDMDTIMEIARRHDLLVIEDAAQGVNAYDRGRALGSIADLGCYSFHDTKNVVCGEGGALCVNNPDLVERAEILRDKGTNRRKFWRGQVDKYTWVDHGSSYVPSEIACAFLFGQLEALDAIQLGRDTAWRSYMDRLQLLEDAGYLRLPTVPVTADHNSHIMYVLLDSQQTRENLITHLARKGISAVFHYVPLHSSPMGEKVGRVAGEMVNTDDLSARLLRLPMYQGISDTDVARVCGEIGAFFRQHATAAA